jgi:hypothetical protein
MRLTNGLKDLETPRITWNVHAQTIGSSRMERTYVEIEQIAKIKKIIDQLHKTVAIQIETIWAVSH